MNQNCILFKKWTKNKSLWNFDGNLYAIWRWIISIIQDFNFPEEKKKYEQTVLNNTEVLGSQAINYHSYSEINNVLTQWDSFSPLRGIFDDIMLPRTLVALQV